MRISPKIVILQPIISAVVEVFTTKDSLQRHLDVVIQPEWSLGLVPTMGALHAGHLALVNTSLSQNEMTVVSVFVNPTQFDKIEDLDNYPRTMDKDLELLKTLSATNVVVYAPSVEDIYGKDVRSESYDFGGLELEMEGKYRLGHFDGVATVVSSLFEIVNPNKAYFGEKDYQQLLIIKKLVDLKGYPITIVPCEIYRESNGLAMSSRNNRLSSESRERASFIYKTLKAVKAKFGTLPADELTQWVQAEFKAHPLLQLEYFTIADDVTLKPIDTVDHPDSRSFRAFIAVFVDGVRLIDNIGLN